MRKLTLADVPVGTPVRVAGTDDPNFVRYANLIGETGRVVRVHTHRVTIRFLDKPGYWDLAIKPQYLEVLT